MDFVITERNHMFNLVAIQTIQLCLHTFVIGMKKWMKDKVFISIKYNYNFWNNLLFKFYD
jgi:hypothetical protein